MIIMSEQTMMEKITQIFPDATIGEDNQGQLIIYTDCCIRGMRDPNDEVHNVVVDDWTAE
jgi:hypothetical protein